MLKSIVLSVMALVGLRNSAALIRKIRKRPTVIYAETLGKLRRISRERSTGPTAMFPREYFKCRCELDCWPYPMKSCMVIFYGGPINGETHAMPEPYPDWNVPVIADLDPLNPIYLEEDSPPMPVAVDVYHYERQFWFGPKGEVVYLCTEREG